MAKEIKELEIQEVLSRLQNKKRSGNGWVALCPTHPDTTASLSVGEGENGKPLLYCHANKGCSYEGILRALDLYDDKPKSSYSKTNSKPTASKMLAQYSYTDEENRVLYQIIRNEPKKFVGRKPNGSGGWIWNLEGVQRVPYHLPELVEAKSKNLPVFICEGEKDVDNVRQVLGLIATTTALGAGNWNNDYAEFFDGLDVIILPDHDEPGERYAQQIAMSIWGTAQSIKVVELPNLQDKEDVSDWIERGGTKEDLFGLISEAPEWNPEDFQLDGNLESGNDLDTSLRVISDDDITRWYDYFIEANLTDTGNAECFAHQYNGEFIYNKTNKEWLFWDGVVWKKDITEKINSAILNTIRARQRAFLMLDTADQKSKASSVSSMIMCENVKFRTSMRKAIEMMPEFITTIEQFDKDKSLIATKNGTINLRDRSFYYSDRKDLITLQMGTNFEAEAVCSRWEQFLEEVFDNDEEMIDFIQRIIGYSLTGETSEQKIFMLYGYGNNGKSVFIRTIDALLGSYAGTASFKTFDADKKNEQSNDLAMLKGKRFVAMSEADADSRLNEPLIKKVTGEDLVTCRFLFKEFFHYEPQFKLFLATNHKPVIRQVDRGIWRRIVLIPFSQNFTGREEKNLKEQLLAELPGILNWALKGLEKWQAEGLNRKPQVVIEATEKYKLDSDTISQWLDLKTVKDVNGSISSSFAYNEYKNWALENGYIPLHNRNFKLSLEERGYRLVKKSDANYWLGFNWIFKLNG